jgi:hypothetical protein
MPAADISKILTLSRAPAPVKALPASIEEMVALQPATPVAPAVPAVRSCTRCGGLGKKDYEDHSGKTRSGKCFRCEGDGVEPDKATANARWEAGQARKALAAEKRAKQDKASEQQCAAPAGMGDILALNAPANDPVEAPAPAVQAEVIRLREGLDAATANVTLRLAIADAVLACGSPEGLPANVREALLSFYMGGGK